MMQFVAASSPAQGEVVLQTRHVETSRGLVVAMLFVDERLEFEKVAEPLHSVEVNAHAHVVVRPQRRQHRVQELWRHALFERGA